MRLNSTNNPREDSSFRTCVKEPILRHHGVEGMVNALLEFHSLYYESLASGRGGVNYAVFETLLKSFHLSPNPSELAYLCRSFDDSNSGFISLSTFTRHFVGTNYRRMKVVKEVWASLPKSSEGTVPLESLVDVYNLVHQGTSYPPHNMSAIFGSDRNRECRQKIGRAPDAVAFEEFAAYAAAISFQTPSDQEFCNFILCEWGRRQPGIHAASQSTEEENEEEYETSDPLEIKRPLYVKDAINFSLGIPSSHYNYSHNQRYWRHVPELPEINRAEMKSVLQHDYVAYSEEERRLADPLATRIGQLH